MSTSTAHFQISDLIGPINTRLRAKGAKPLSYSAMWPRVMEFSIRLGNRRLIPQENVPALMKHLGLEA